jgi:hypothetical protein
MPFAAQTRDPPVFDRGTAQGISFCSNGSSSAVAKRLVIRCGLPLARVTRD